MTRLSVRSIGSIAACRMSRISPFAIAACLVVSACSGCGNALLARYRNPQLLRTHTYRLGEKYESINGVRVCYQEQGTGPDVVILPGLGTSVDFWQSNIPALSRKYHVVAVDPPGFGKSDKPDGTYDLMRICDNIRLFLAARGINHASFIGGSMGGHLAMLIALSHPECVDKLVLMGSSGTWTSPGPLLRVALDSPLYEPLVINQLRYHWPGIYSKMFLHPSPVSQEVLRYQMAVRADEARYGPEGRAAARALRSIFYRSCRYQADQIQAPMLLIWGEQDRIHPWKAGTILRDRVPDSRLVVVPNAGHEVMVDQPDVFNRLVLRFFQGGTGAVPDHLPGSAKGEMDTGFRFLLTDSAVPSRTFGR